MSRRNYQITLDEANPGMELADSLLDSSGNILLPTGAILTATSISSLQRRGIDALAILGEEVPDTDDDAAEMERRRQRLARLFRKQAEDHSATDLLRQLITNFRLGAQS